MSSRFKFVPFLVVFITVAHAGFGQSQIDPSKFRTSFGKLFNETPDFYFNLNKNKPFRYSGLRYFPTKINDLHVVSIAQPNNMFDNVYYINQKGQTVFQSINITAPMNRFPNSIGYDSFNPTGAASLQGAVLQGLWDTFLTFKIDTR